MRSLRRVELVLGMLVGILGLAGVAVGWLAPYGGNSERVFRDGHLIEASSSTYSFADTVGLRVALAVLITFALLVAWVSVASILHWRSRTGGWLSAVWAGTAVLVLVLVTWGTTVLLAYLFWPSAVLALACAVLATVRNARMRRVQ